jgi:hypothetical protein
VAESQIAEPQIKDHLESPELTTNVTEAVRQRLSACLASDPNHITPGQKEVAFWVLQRERHNPGHMPYRLKVVIQEDIEGSF